MRVVALGDIHFPFHKKCALDRAIDEVAKVRPHFVVQMGDLYEQQCFANWPRSHDLMTPREEMDLARGQAVDFWARIRKAAPRARYHQLLGNHDARMLKRVWERFPEGEAAARRWLKDLYRFDGVQTVASDRDVLTINSVNFVHGWTTQGKHATHLAGNTVVGHTHKGALTYVPGNHWELNVGWLGDFTQPPFWYRPTKVRETTVGIGVLDDYGPRFIPYE